MDIKALIDYCEANAVPKTIPDDPVKREQHKYYMAVLYNTLCAVVNGIEKQGYLPDISWNYAQHLLSNLLRRYGL